MKDKSCRIQGDIRECIYGQNHLSLRSIEKMVGYVSVHFTVTVKCFHTQFPVPSLFMDYSSESLILTSPL